MNVIGNPNIRYISPIIEGDEYNEADEYRAGFCDMQGISQGIPQAIPLMRQLTCPPKNPAKTGIVRSITTDFDTDIIIGNTDAINTIGNTDAINTIGNTIGNTINNDGYCINSFGIQRCVSDVQYFDNTRSTSLTSSTSSTSSKSSTSSTSSTEEKRCTIEGSIKYFIRTPKIDFSVIETPLGKLTYSTDEDKFREMLYSFSPNQYDLYMSGNSSRFPSLDYFGI
jgi:hypothetical protein